MCAVEHCANFELYARAPIAIAPPCCGCLGSVMEWWNGIVEWNTGMSFLLTPPPPPDFRGYSTTKEIKMAMAKRKLEEEGDAKVIRVNFLTKF